MTKRKSETKAPAADQLTVELKIIAERNGIVVRSEDRREFALMLERAEDMGLSERQAVTAFVAARAAIAATLVGRQRPASYADDRRRAFAAARHACLVPEGA